MKTQKRENERSKNARQPTVKSPTPPDVVPQVKQQKCLFTVDGNVK